MGWVDQAPALESRRQRVNRLCSPKKSHNACSKTDARNPWPAVTTFASAERTSPESDSVAEYPPTSATKAAPSFQNLPKPGETHRRSAGSYKPPDSPACDWAPRDKPAGRSAWNRQSCRHSDG